MTASKDWIRQLFLFEHTDFDMLDRTCRILERCETRTCQVNEVLLSSECPLCSLGVVLSGSVLMLTSAAEKEIPLRQAFAGDSFGAASLFSSAAHRTRVVAMEKTEIFLLPEDLLRDLMSADTNVSVNYIRFLSERIAFLNRKIAIFTAGSANGKLAMYLLSQLPQNAREFRCGISMTELALQLGIARASLYRAIDELSQKGILRYDGKTFTVYDPSVLQKMLE